MVSQAPAAPTSRDRILAAAAAEFAARGFDGAKVDRIAAKARLNKAMLYYHFRNKAALYRAILTDLFRSLAHAVAAGRDEGGTPQEQIQRFIRIIATQTAAQPHFPAIWLREMAEGGRHIDASIVRELRRVLDVLGTILGEGRGAGVFGPAHPLVTQMGIVAPLLLFAVSAPVRERFQQQIPQAIAGVTREDVISHVEIGTLAVLTGVVASGPRPKGSRRQRS